MAFKPPRKDPNKRKKSKRVKSPVQKQVQSESQFLSGELERDVYAQDQGSTVYGHGDFQRLICCFTVLALIVLQCHSQAFALVARPVDHWCRPPPKFAVLSVAGWKNVGIPLDEQGRYSECLAYAQPGHQPNETETYECDAWHYDPARAAQSAIRFWDLVCRRSWLVQLGDAVYMSGALLVVPVAGHAADNLGRKTIINISVVVLLASTAAMCISRIYPFFLLTKFISSACASTIFVVSLILLYEVAPLTYRVFYISVSCALAALLADVLLFILASFPLSWSMLQMAVLCPTVLLAFSTCAVHESPVWLLTVSRMDEAQAAMIKAARMNNMNREQVKQSMQRVKTELSITSASTTAPIAVQHRRHQIARVLILAFTMMLGFYSLSWSRRLRKGTTIAIVAVMMSAPSYVVMYLVLTSLGRLQFLLVVTALLGGACSLCSVAIYAKPRLVGDVLLVFAQSCARVLVPSSYLYIAELFPTTLRSRVMCGAYAVGRLGAMVASALTLLEGVGRADLMFAIVGSALLGCVLAIFGLPETSHGLTDTRLGETDKDVLKAMQDTLSTTHRPRSMLTKKAKAKP